MQISPSFLYNAAMGDGINQHTVTREWHSCQHIECYTVGSQGMLHWSTCHQNLSDYRPVSIACHEHISHWFTIVMLVISRTLNMSWTHQSLVHRCHINPFQNFEHAMDTPVIWSPLSYQSFTEFWTCHYISTAVASTPLSGQSLIYHQTVISSSYRSLTKYHSMAWAQ